MHIVTAEEMRRLDASAIDELGIPGMVLMENAGREIALEAIQYSKKYWPNKTLGKMHWAILVGKGNNGGDGLVAARHLIEAGTQVTVIYAVHPQELTAEAAVQRDIIAGWKINSATYRSESILWHKYDGIIDAMLGTGSRGAPREPYASLIKDANESGLPILAADVPSGLNADTGEVSGSCIRAQATVTLAFIKRGLTQYPGAEFAGRVILKRIGIPAFLAEEHNVRTFILDEQTVQHRLCIDPSLPRNNDSHKGTYGHLLVVAGTLQMGGAGLLCAKAGLRAGSGLVTLAVPERLSPLVVGRVPEVMLAGVPDGQQGNWSQTSPQQIIRLADKKSCLTIGPGLGRFAGDGRWLRAIWEGTACPLVCDADALNILAECEDFSAWGKRVAPVVLTPHPGEMSRLLNLSTAEIQKNRIELARTAAAKFGAIVILKGAGTVIACPDGEVYINTTGNPGMATGGSGDVLTGVIGGLLAQGLDGKQAACLGVYLHGLAGDRAANRRNSPHSLIAGDIIEEL